MNPRSEDRAQWLRSPRVQLTGMAILAFLVVVRLVVTTYLSWSTHELPAVRMRLTISWVLSLIALSLLSKFAGEVLKRQRQEPGK